MGDPQTPPFLVIDSVSEPVRFETVLLVVSNVNVLVKTESLGRVIGSWNVSATE